MTIAGALAPRWVSFADGGSPGPGSRRVFRVDAENSVEALCHWQADPEPRGALLLVHGLGGDASSPYVVGTASKALAQGLHVVRLNVRNCGGTEHLASSHYNGGITEDVFAVARELAEQDGIPRVHLAGFSLGGNHVLRLAALLGASSPPWLASVATICPCLDFQASVRRLDSPGVLFRLYRWRFLASLRTILQRRAQLDGTALDVSELRSIRRIREFDARYTAPNSGYASVDDYYDRAGTGTAVSEVRVPSLVIASEDDPLIPFEGLRQLVEGAPRVRMIATRRGGHLGFVSRRRLGAVTRDRRWAEHELLRFVRAQEDRHAASTPSGRDPG